MLRPARRLSPEESWYAQQPRSVRRAVLSLQWDLTLSGFGRGREFAALACWREAVTRLRRQAAQPAPPDEDIFNLETA